MQYQYVLLRFGEIFLKGKNINLFKRKLVDNVKKITGQQVKKLRNRVILPYFDDYKSLKRVFGLVSYSLCLKTSWNIEEIKKKAEKLIKDKKGTFLVRTKRSDKRFEIKSPKLNEIIGEHCLKSNEDLVTDFKDPKNILYIEINEDGAYLYTEIINCFGGLPVGVEGRALLLVEDKNSLLAGLLFMKRGVNIYPVAFKEFDISLLEKYSPEKLHLEIVKDFNEIEVYAKKNKCCGLILGQTLDFFKEIETSLVIFRPLISINVEEELGKYIH